MAEKVDVFWSFRSPYSYLVTEDLVKLHNDFDVDVKLRVVLPLAIRNKAAVFADKKPGLYILMDAQRRADFLVRPYAWPNPDPILQDRETLSVAEEQPYIYRLSKLGVEAGRQGKGLEFAAVVSRLIFGGTQRWDEGDHLSLAASSCDLNLHEMDSAIALGDHLTESDRNHDALAKVGHWGVPTMAVRGEPFFGQDRIETLRWRLDQYALGKKSGS